jgi:Heparinase II/III N-terminus/Heparinase II/III-like protein
MPVERLAQSGVDVAKPGKPLWLMVLCLAAPFALLILIWVPEFEHFRVPKVTITPAMLDRARGEPTDELLDEIREYRLLGHDWETDSRTVSIAEKLLKGRAELPGYPGIDIHLPFDPSDLERGPSLWQLEFAGFIVPEVLIDAYRRTGREEFYAMARDVLVAWSNYTDHAWLNHGFLWNDHATSARIRTLVDFWSIYRHRPDYSPEVARKILRFAAHSAALLAKPDLYTFATNHGLMQNLALWQICLAFPSLPKTAEYKMTVFSRLKYQLDYYLGPSGVILENSPDYHEYGVYLLGVALRYATLLNLKVPTAWAERYEGAKRFYGLLRRPDGTLPMLGDTEAKPRPGDFFVAHPDASGVTGPLKRPVEWKPEEAFGFYPVAGYVVVWDGLKEWKARTNISQAVMSWSYFPGHAHKHADELSVLLWADGQNWWTNVGYWPYDNPDRPEAECWQGSNAPHMLGEACLSDRTSSLISYYYSEGLSAFEMERRGPETFRARRLVIHLAPDIWVIADACYGGSGRPTQTIWTTAPNVKIKQTTDPDEFTQSVDGEPRNLKTTFLGPPSTEIHLYRGSHSPFAGWVSNTALPGGGQASEAIVTTRPANDSWGFTVWDLRDANARPGPADKPAWIVERKNEQDWTIKIPTSSGIETIVRQGDEISVRKAASSRKAELTVTMKPAPQDVAARVAALNTSFEENSKRYPRYREIAKYRFRATILTVALLALQEIFFFVYRRFRFAGEIALRILVLASWVGVGVWMQFFYLRIS